MANPGYRRPSTCYDGANRLKAITNTSAISGMLSPFRYSLDNVGNRTVFTTTSGLTTTYSYRPADRIVTAGAASCTWDANGNVLSTIAPSGTITYSYDYANRLKVVTGTAVSSYAYNGDGLRVARTVDGASTQYTWDIAAALPVIIDLSSPSSPR